MTFSDRRQFLHLVFGIAALPALPLIAKAQVYPSRSMHIVLSYPAGSTPDLVTRLVGRRLSERLGQEFVVDNRPSTNIATEMMMRAPPDGHMLLMTTMMNAI